MMSCVAEQMKPVGVQRTDSRCNSLMYVDE